jgi:hypothetical protein
MKKTVRRIKDMNNLFVKTGSKVVITPIKDVLREHKVNSIIRFRKEEFNQLKKHSIITHFNLQSTNHRKGNKYLLALIIKPGFFDGKKEKPPIISFNKAPVGLCLGARNNIPYDKLRAEDFKHSFESIKNVEQLKKAILKRYSQSMAHLTPEKILSLGVGITRLKILKK